MYHWWALSKFSHSDLSCSQSLRSRTCSCEYLARGLIQKKSSTSAIIVGIFLPAGVGLIQICGFPRLVCSGFAYERSVYLRFERHGYIGGGESTIRTRDFSRFRFGCSKGGLVGDATKLRISRSRWRPARDRLADHEGRPAHIGSGLPTRCCWIEPKRSLASACPWPQAVA